MDSAKGKRARDVQGQALTMNGLAAGGGGGDLNAGRLVADSQPADAHSILWIIDREILPATVVVICLYAIVAPIVPGDY